MTYINMNSKNIQIISRQFLSVSEDGITVFLHPVNQEQMYVYQVPDNTMVKKPYNPDGAVLYHNQYDDVETGKYASYEKDGKTQYIVNGLRLEVRVDDMSEENMEKIRSYETMGEAIRIVESEGEMKLEDLHVDGTYKFVL